MFLPPPSQRKHVRFLLLCVCRCYDPTTRRPAVAAVSDRELVLMCSAAADRQRKAFKNQDPPPRFLPQRLVSSGCCSRNTCLTMNLTQEDCPLFLNFLDCNQLQTRKVNNKRDCVFSAGAGKDTVGSESKSPHVWPPQRKLQPHNKNISKYFIIALIYVKVILNVIYVIRSENKH